LKQTSGWDATTKPKAATTSGWDAKYSDDRLSLKEKIKLLTGDTASVDDVTGPTREEISKIESANFIQEKFSSTYIDPSNMPKQKKKKKNKQKQSSGVSKSADDHKSTSLSDVQKRELVSHEDAMFSNTMDTLHLTKFSSQREVKVEGLKEGIVVDEDSIFGAMFFDDPEIRKQRWLSKLTKLRKRFTDEGA